MSAGLLSLLVTFAVPIVLIVLVVRAVGNRHQARPGEGHGVRRFFQYLLLLGLMIVTASGVTGLLGLAVDRPAIVDTGGTLARDLTFAVMGGGLFVAVVVWTRRVMRADPSEVASVAWTVYLTLAGLVAAGVTASFAGTMVASIAGPSFDGPAAVGLVVWGGAWAVHWRLTSRTQDGPRMLALLVLGSLAGWIVVLVGLTGVLDQVLGSLVPAQVVVASRPTPVVGALGVLVAGALLWVPHWLMRLSRAPSDPLWLGYVLVVGVGASLVMALTGASIVVYRALVWFIGEPGAVGGADYVRGTTTALAVMITGGLGWWYHRAVLAGRATPVRNEVTRIYEYLLAGIALGAAVTGVALLVVAVMDAAVPISSELVRGPVLNEVIAAVTLLVVGGPLWWQLWRRIQRARAADAAEVLAPTRRVYLVLLFGVAGVVAVIVVLVAVFLVLNDALRGSLGAATVSDLRVPVGILVATGTVSAYHWMVQREDREIAPARQPRVGPRRILLVGPRDDVLAAEIHRVTGARVEGWPAEGPAWDVPAVLAALAPVDAPQVLVLGGPDGLRVVGSRPDAGQSGDEPRGGGRQGQAQLDEHAQAGGPQSEPGGVARGDGVAQP